MSRMCTRDDGGLRVWKRVAAAGLLWGSVDWPASGQDASRHVLAGEDAARVKALEAQLSALQAEGRFADAVAPAREIVSIRSRVQGEDHHATVDARIQEETMVRVAAMPEADRSAFAVSTGLMKSAQEQWRGGHYAAARPMLERASEIQRRLLGERHPTTGESLRNLAFNLNSQGRYAEAEGFAEQALAILRRTMGPEHLAVAVALNNLAYSLNAQGRHAEAQPMAERALVIPSRRLRAAPASRSLRCRAAVARCWGSPGSSIRRMPSWARTRARRSSTI